VYSWADGSKYEGEWKDGVKHGTHTPPVEYMRIARVSRSTGIAKSNIAIWGVDASGLVVQAGAAMSVQMATNIRGNTSKARSRDTASRLGRMDPVMR
jgi:hypothetical protein